MAVISTTFIPANECIKVEPRFVMFSQQCENVFYVQSSAGTGLTQQVAVAEIVKNTFVSELLPHLGEDVSLVSVKTTDWTTHDGPTNVYTDGLPVSGGSGGYCLPGGSTLSVKFGTSNRGRGASGRQYIVGVPGAVQEGNQVSAVFANHMIAAYTSLMEALSLVDYVLSVCSFYVDHGPRTMARVAPVTSVTANLDIDSQRRRLTGRGR